MAETISAESYRSRYGIEKLQDHNYRQRWLTERTNRTEHFRGPVLFIRVRRHIDMI